MKDCDEVIQLLAGLGLANTSLSFIDAPDRVVQSSGGKSSHPPRTDRNTPAPRSQPQQGELHALPMKMPKLRRDPNSPPQRRSETFGSSSTNLPQGKDTLGKFSTAQLQTALKTGTIDLKARVKKTAGDSFVAIGFYPEFEKAVEGRLVKEKAERKSAGLKSEFDRIGRQYDRRGWTRWFKNLISGTAGLVNLIVWLAFVFGSLAAVVIFRQPIWDTIAQFVNSFQK